MGKLGLPAVTAASARHDLAHASGRRAAATRRGRACRASRACRGAIALLAVGFGAAAVGQSPQTSFDDASRSAAEAIDAADLERVVAELASDRYEGRAPGTRGDELTLRFLERELERRGFEPGMSDGSWRQSFDLVGITASQPAEWQFVGGAERVVLSQGDDFIAASGVQRERAEIDGAELVFVGFGIVAPEHDW